MRILVTNDDGIHSPGLWSVAKVLNEIGDVTVVAPDRDQSGVGASMSLMNVVRSKEVESQIEGITAHAVQGTPADCVILANETLIREPVDLLVSGINQGSNLGLDVITSGTVGAAFMGYFRKIPSIALSVASLTNLHYEAAAMAGGAIARYILRSESKAPVLLNVNLPNTSPDKISGVEITKLGPRQYIENVSSGHDGRHTHYWIKHNKSAGFTVQEGADILAVRNNKVSISKIDLDGNGSSVNDEAMAIIANEVATGLQIATT